MRHSSLTEERVFKIIAFRHDEDFAAQIARYPEVFSGNGQQATSKSALRY